MERKGSVSGSQKARMVSVSLPSLYFVLLIISLTNEKYAYIITNGNYLR